MQLKKWPYPMEYVEAFELGYSWTLITPRWCSWFLFIYKHFNGKKVRLDWYSEHFKYPK